MKCISCKGEWTPPLGITVTECPFCKKSLATSNPKIYDNAKDALRFIAETHGAESLLTKNIFSDIAPTLTDERKLIKMFRDEGALEVLKSALNLSASEQEIAIKRATAKLPAFLRSSLEAVSLLNDFVEALGWQMTKPEPPPQLVNIVPLTQPSPIQTQQPQAAPSQRQSGGIVSPPKVGSSYKFGNYDWLVLDVRNDEVLLLSEKIIENKQFYNTVDHKRLGETWGKSYMRHYLNNDFLCSLNQEDKVRINHTTIAYPRNPWIDAYSDYKSSTKDHVFLLSLEEIVQYFGDSGSLMTGKNRGTWDSERNYAKLFLSGNYMYSIGDKIKVYKSRDELKINDQYNAARIAYDTRGNKVSWWLRSSGLRENSDKRRQFACVSADGILDIEGCPSIMGLGVRPAVWLSFR